jgi:hypothetical protein
MPLIYINTYYWPAERRLMSGNRHILNYNIVGLTTDSF